MRQSAKSRSSKDWETLLESGRVRLEPDASILATIQGENAILLNYERGEYYGLNDTGSFIWNLVREGVPVPGIIDAVVSEFEVEQRIAAKGVLSVLSDLCTRGVLKVSE